MSFKKRLFHELYANLFCSGTKGDYWRHEWTKEGWNNEGVPENESYVSFLLEAYLFLCVKNYFLGITVAGLTPSFSIGPWRNPSPVWTCCSTPSWYLFNTPPSSIALLSMSTNASGKTMLPTCPRQWLSVAGINGLSLPHMIILSSALLQVYPHHQFLVISKNFD